MKDRWSMFKKGGGRQAFLTNSPLIIVNHPKRKKGTMAKAKRSHSGQFKRKKSSRRKYRPNPTAAVHRSKSRRGSAGMNFMGITVPPLERVFFAGVGALGPELIEWAVEEFAPDFIASEGGQTAVQIGSYIAPSLLALALGGRRVANDVAFGGLINLSMVGGRKLIASVREGSSTGGAEQVAGYLTGAVVGHRQLAGYIPRRPGLRGYRTSPDRLAKRYPDANYR